ncbi:MAG: Fis family transcriptional regulator [Hydrogenophaga sp.]|uniref:helix-turn-helix domain-containing protein n=1 Tax=Hydrogenophaga sp. TaxID=1904254 RepID=UPI001DF6B23B|nr:helix-turn-helix domain-containing protein [Hydrogenophaga sp.]MBX3610726.1 Fis family transcriptional regulator [Hydrogenophaga sp.]
MPASAQPLFFQTVEQRTALARQRFFEEGERPSGLVNEAVIQSWMRCTGARRNSAEPIAFDPVTRSRMHACLTRNQQLLAAGNEELQQLATALSGTNCRVLLTDPQGVVIHASAPTGSATQPLLNVACRVGVSLAESDIGTTAPGIVAKTAVLCAVSGGEHYHDMLQRMHCAAAPIRDVHGRLAGVLDVSIEGNGFGFDAGALVALYASTIENHLLRLQSPAHLVLQFQASPKVLGTPLEALAGVDVAGRLTWLNPVAQRLTGAALDQTTDVAEVFGQPLDALLALHREPAPRAWRLPNGLTVWVRAHIGVADGVDFNHAVALAEQVAVATASDVAAPTPAATVVHSASHLPDSTPEPATAATLDHHRDRAIQAALQASGGNIARAARQLGVSRGLLYRRLRAQGDDPARGSD